MNRVDRLVDVQVGIPAVHDFNFSYFCRHVPLRIAEAQDALRAVGGHKLYPNISGASVAYVANPLRPVRLDLPVFDCLLAGADFLVPFFFQVECQQCFTSLSPSFYLDPFAISFL